MRILDGRKTADKIYSYVKSVVDDMPVKPALAIISVGNDYASQIYIRNKEKACEKCGIVCKKFTFDVATTETLCHLIHYLNDDVQVKGILVQLPLPNYIYEQEVINSIVPEKDVDGFTIGSVGMQALGTKCVTLPFWPCTAKGIIELLKYNGISIEGKHVVIIGRSNIVGKPLARLMLQSNATVTVCHSKTKDLASITRTADILIAAVGKKHFVTADMIKEGAIVIDVGINRDDNGKVTGDVDFENVKDKAAAITPVPGGVGPMTVATLMLNILSA